MNFAAPNYASSVIQSEQVGEWGAVRPPKAPTDRGRHASQSYVAGFTMGVHSENKDAAWEAVKYLYSEEGRKCNWSTVNFWAWYQDLEEWIQGQPGMDESFNNALAYAGTQDAVFIPRLKSFNRFFNEAVDPWSDLVFTDEMSPEEAAQNMVAEGDRVLEEMKEM
jgi:ABC-type glycerol-3-phosphate transport system substrate-binding protein